MMTPDRDLARSIRFAMQATKDLDLLSPQTEGTAVERLAMVFGHDVAKALFPKKKGSPSAVLEVLAPFWSENRLANIVFTRSDPETIKLYDCYDCDATRAGYPPRPCTFKKSLLETVFRDALGTKLHFDELECCKTGGAACVFRLIPLKPMHS